MKRRRRRRQLLLDLELRSQDCPRKQGKKTCPQQLLFLALSLEFCKEDEWVTRNRVNQRLAVHT